MSQRVFGHFERSVFLSFFLLFASALASPVAAQGVTGTVLDRETDEPVTGVVLLLRSESGSAVARSETGDDGRFTLVARSAGLHVIEVQRLGYASLPPQPITLETDLVEVEIRISRAPIEMDPVTVTGRRHDPRHEATLEGALARHELFPRVGSRRVALRSGPEFVGAMEVQHVLQWFGPRSGCTILYRDGRLVNSAEIVQGLFLEGPADWWQAIEFYRRYQDAPRDLRDVPPYVRSPFGCTVVALWSRDDPAAPGRSIWTRLAYLGGFFAVIWFVVPNLLGF